MHYEKVNCTQRTQPLNGSPRLLASTPMVITIPPNTTVGTSLASQRFYAHRQFSAQPYMCADCNMQNVVGAQDKGGRQYVVGEDLEK
jgi:hypothetical protein